MTKYLNTRDGSIEDAAVKTVEKNVTFEKKEIKLEQPQNRYLDTRDTSLEAAVTKVVTEGYEGYGMKKKMEDSEYQAMFKKELEKTGKSLSQMSDQEKKDFFNKIDSKHSAKNEKVDNPYAVGMAAAMKKTGDKPPLKKSTITKAHDIAKSIEKDEKKEGYEGKSYKSYKEMKKEADMLKNMKTTMTKKPITPVDVQPKTDSLAGYATTRKI